MCRTVTDDLEPARRAPRRGRLPAQEEQQRDAGDRMWNDRWAGETAAQEAASGETEPGERVAERDAEGSAMMVAAWPREP